MSDLLGFPSAEVLYRADGSVDASDAAAHALAADPDVTDLLVITHGWNNDVLGARDLFAQLARSLLQGAFSHFGFAADWDLDTPGAQSGLLRTEEALPGTLLPVGGAYPWQPHRPHNLLADAFVADHSDVKGPEVAYALLSAAAAS